MRESSNQPPAFPVRAHLRTASGRVPHQRAPSAVKQEQPDLEFKTVMLGSLQAALAALERLETRVEHMEREFATMQREFATTQREFAQLDGRWADQLEERLARALEERLDVNVIANRVINAVVPAVEAVAQRAARLPPVPQPSPMAHSPNTLLRNKSLLSRQTFNSRSLLAATPFNHSVGFTLTDSLGVSDNGTDWGNSSFLYRTPQALSSVFHKDPPLSTVLDESEAPSANKPPLVRLDIDQLTSSQPYPPQDSNETLCATNDPASEEEEEDLLQPS